MSYYLVRVGEGAKYIYEAHKYGYIAIGWSDVPPLDSLDSLDAIKREVALHYSHYSPSQVGAQSGQLHRFGHLMRLKDIVISPFKDKSYLVGVIGDYYYEENPQDGCDFKHRRKVAWRKETIFKEDMSTNLSYAVGATLTVFSLDKYSPELDALIMGRPYSPAEKPQRIRDIVLQGLMELSGQEFEEFIQHLLEVIGFTAETTQYIGDKGIDVNGILNAEGVADIILRVQVKRVRSSISNKDILALRGTLGQGEHGCLITLSSFTTKAQEEALAPGKLPIKTIDGDDLAGLILKHFDEFDEKYKDKFAVRRKKNFNIEAMFEPVT